LDNDKFVQGFVPRPEVDRALSTEKSRYSDFEKENKYLKEEWYPQAKAAYEKNQRGIATLQKYMDTYGPIDDSDPDATRRAARSTGLTEDKVLELLNAQLDTRLSARDRATLDLMQVREDYMDRFKKRLPLNEFESYVEQERKRGNGDSVQALYNSWIAPEVEKMTPHRFSEEELKARDKRIQEDAVKDFASRHRVPVDARPKEAHLLLDNARLRQEKEKSGDTGKSAREEFLDILSDPEPETLKKRYPV
jgi:hypothetical protein